MSVDIDRPGLKRAQAVVAHDGDTLHVVAGVTEDLVASQQNVKFHNYAEALGNGANVHIDPDEGITVGVSLPFNRP